MDKVDKKILNYLTEKNWASEVAVINETFKDFDLSKEEYIHRLELLKNKDFVHYERPFGSGAFIRITEKGRFTLRPFCEKAKNYIVGNILEMLTLIITVITLFLTLN